MVCITQECWPQPLCDGFCTSWIVLKLPFSVVMLVVQTCPRGLWHLWSFCGHLLWIWQLSFGRIPTLWFVFYYMDPSKYLHTPELVVLGRCKLVSGLLLGICTCFFEEVEDSVSIPSNNFDMMFPFKACRELNAKVWVMLHLFKVGPHYLVCVRDDISLSCYTKEGALFGIKTHLPLLWPGNHGVKIFL